MVVKVHCGTILRDAFSAWWQIHPLKQSHIALGQPSRPGLPRNLKVAKSPKKERKKKPSHNAIQHNSDGASRATSSKRPMEQAV